MFLTIPDELVSANGWDKNLTTSLTEIKGRSNAMWGLAKKPYQFKMSGKKDLLGIGTHKTWILLANHGDRSLIRNKLVYDMALSIGIDYSPESEFVDVFMNGRYAGHYTDLMDVESFDKLYWINEIVKNSDFFQGSTFMYKDRNTEKGHSIRLEPVQRIGLFLRHGAAFRRPCRSTQLPV